MERAGEAEERIRLQQSTKSRTITELEANGALLSVYLGVMSPGGSANSGARGWGKGNNNKSCSASNCRTSKGDDPQC